MCLRDELQCKVAEVADVNDQDRSSSASKGQLENLAKQQEAGQAEAARQLSRKEECASLESRCV